MSTWDPDATSGLPGARARFRANIRREYAQQNGWAVEDTLIEEVGAGDGS